jgi:hypothetical protein
VLPAAKPPPREVMGMTYDPTNKRVVMFGGRNGQMLSTDETWTYDGVTWTKLASPVTPGPRGNVRMAFHPDRDAVLMFGGYDWQTNDYLDDTWLLVGDSWTMFEGPGPSARYGSGMATLAGDVLLFGGYRDMYFGDTWLFD